VTPDEFWAILHNAPDPEPVYWRLYHDDQGRPVCYSMEDQPGNYIDVDAETYALAPFNVRVVNGTLKYIAVSTVNKLVPSDSGTLCHTQNIAVVVEQNGTYWSKQTHDKD
jgi:hypothetical protein